MILTGHDIGCLEDKLEGWGLCFCFRTCYSILLWKKVMFMSTLVLSQVLSVHYLWCTWWPAERASFCLLLTGGRVGLWVIKWPLPDSGGRSWMQACLMWELDFSVVLYCVCFLSYWMPSVPCSFSIYPLINALTIHYLFCLSPVCVICCRNWPWSQGAQE